MLLEYQEKLQDLITSFKIDTEYLVIKPNWVDGLQGNFTAAEVLDIVLASCTSPKKMIVESYTSGRRAVSDQEEDKLVFDLIDGKDHWSDYQERDQAFLRSSGISEVLDKHNAAYLNVTNEYWSNRAANPDYAKAKTEAKYDQLIWAEFYSYVPQAIVEIAPRATLLSLAKIKEEKTNPHIVASLSLKNLFGLIPHPSRYAHFHKNDHRHIPEIIIDIAKVYLALFTRTYWVNEGLTSVVKNYCEANQTIEGPNGLLVGSDSPIKADGKTCKQIGINPKNVPYLCLAEELF